MGIDPSGDEPAIGIRGGRGNCSQPGLDKSARVY